MVAYGSAVILGRRELKAALDNLPAKVAKKVFDVWTQDKAREIANIAKRLVPRDRRSPRRKPETARLWRAIRSGPVRNLTKFKGTISRAIAYGASAPSGRSRGKTSLRIANRNRRLGRAPIQTVRAPRARHFHLAVRGTAERIQRSTGRRTGRMWGATPNPRFWDRAAEIGLRSAQGEVGASLRDAYDKALQRHLNSLVRKYR